MCCGTGACTGPRTSAGSSSRWWTSGSSSPNPATTSPTSKPCTHSTTPSATSTSGRESEAPEWRWIDRGGEHGENRVAVVPEVLAWNPDSPFGLRPRGGPDHLQGVGLHQSRVRVQPPHRQRRDLLRAGDRSELQVKLAPLSP